MQQRRNIRQNPSTDRAEPQQFISRIKNQLIEILLTLKQQNQILKLNHLDQIKKLYLIIEDQQREICKLKRHYQQHVQRNIHSTPYKMLGFNHHNCQPNQNYQQLVSSQQPLHIQIQQYNPNIDNQQQKKQSLTKCSQKQLQNNKTIIDKIPLLQRNHKKINNKYKKQNNLCQGFCVQENIQKIGNCLNENIENQQQKIVNAKCRTEREQKEVLACVDNYLNISDRNVNEVACSYQVKSHFSRKPAGKSTQPKRGLFERKSITSDAGKLRLLQMQIPAKMVRVSGISLR